MAGRKGRETASLRAGVTASVALALGALAHTAAHGSPPSWVGLGVLTPFAWLVVTVATRTALTPWRASLLVGGMQVGVHHILAWAPPSMAPAGATHAHHQPVEMETLAAAHVPVEGAGHATTTWMLLAHIAAGVVAGLVIAYGEAAATELAAWLAPVTVGLPALPTVVGRLRLLIGEWIPFPHRPPLLLADRLRGPPVLDGVTAA